MAIAVSFDNQPIDYGASFVPHCGVAGLFPTRDSVDDYERARKTRERRISMPKATWNGKIIAEAADADIERVEGNVYFPAAAVNREYLQPSDTHTVCGWKGTASYYHVAVDGEVNRDAAWYYPEPKEAAHNITGRVAFWKGVKVE
jgi:uncharacterized protein (DUF427 family)